MKNDYHESFEELAAGIGINVSRSSIGRDVTFQSLLNQSSELTENSPTVGKPLDGRGKIIKRETVDGKFVKTKPSPVFGYDVEMYGDDHEPTHVHIMRGSEKLGKVILYPTVHVEDPKTTRIPEKDHARLEEHFKINKKYYQQQWNGLSGKPPKKQVDNHATN